MSAGVEIGGQDGKIRGADVSGPDAAAAEGLQPLPQTPYTWQAEQASLDLELFFLSEPSLFPDITVPEAQGR